MVIEALPVDKDIFCTLAHVFLANSRYRAIEIYALFLVDHPECSTAYAGFSPWQPLTAKPCVPIRP